MTEGELSDVDKKNPQGEKKKSADRPGGREKLKGKGPSSNAGIPSLHYAGGSRQIPGSNRPEW